MKKEKTRQKKKRRYKDLSELTGQQKRELPSWHLDGSQCVQSEPLKDLEIFHH